MSTRKQREREFLQEVIVAIFFLICVIMILVHWGAQKGVAVP